MSVHLKDQIIWDDFKNGNKDALEWVYENNITSMYHYARKFTQDNELIKDLIQELFIELIDSGTRLSETDNIRFYLLKALRNKLIKFLSAGLKYSDKTEEIIMFNLVESIEDQLIRNEVEAQIQNQVVSAVKKLSPKQQEIIYLRFYKELSFSEISDIFGVEIQTVRNLLSRSITSLKEDFQKNKITKGLIFFCIRTGV